MEENSWQEPVLGSAYSRVNSPPYKRDSQLQAVKRKNDMSEPTARTRNNDVFPAFCKPTIVTSISIALGVIISMWVQKLRHL